MPLPPGGAGVPPGQVIDQLRAEALRRGEARAKLDQLVNGYRTLGRAQHRRELRVLRWQRPGTVWAMDFAEAPALIDGVYPYLLEAPVPGFVRAVFSAARTPCNLGVPHHEIAAPALHCRHHFGFPCRIGLAG